MSNVSFTHGLNTVRGALARRYWVAVAILTIANTALFGATGAIAGLSFESFTTGAREVAIFNVLALTVLVWPVMAMTVKGLRAQRNWCCWAAAIHALAVFMVMEAHFGKPFGLASESEMANLVPTLLFMGLTAWIVVEWRLTRTRETLSAI